MSRNVEEKSQFIFRKYLFIYVATLIRTFSEDSLGCFCYYYTLYSSSTDSVGS
jgi:hypothetical protein